MRVLLQFLCLAFAGGMLPLLAESEGEPDSSNQAVAGSNQQSSNQVVENKAEFVWENWQQLVPAGGKNPPQDFARLRFDCDPEALYVRLEIPATLPYASFEPERPAWQLSFELQDALEVGEENQRIFFTLLDDESRDKALEDGIRVLEYAEFDGAERIELLIPRAVVEQVIPWGSAGPSVSSVVTISLQLASYESSAVNVLTNQEGENNSQEQGPQSGNEAEQWPINLRFVSGFSETKELTGRKLPDYKSP